MDEGFVGFSNAKRFSLSHESYWEAVVFSFSSCLAINVQDS